jgi:hypothetical protein
MILPENGRIVIVDDNYAEAEPIVKILSKRRLPYNYYSGTDIEDFPENNNLNKLRVLFLDLNIFELSKSTKEVISSIHGILDRLIPENPNPFLLIIWSKQKDEYANALESHFKKSLKNKIPAQIIYLKKSDYLDYIDGNWVPQADCFDKLSEDLTNRLENISILGNLINWENIVHQSSSDTVNDFSDLYPINDKWNNKIKSVIQRLAKSVIGKDNISTVSNEEKIKRAFYNLNAIFVDNVENDIRENGLGNIPDLNDNGISKEVVTKLNSKLHTITNLSNFTFLEPGNLYKHRKNKKQIEQLLRKETFKTKHEDIVKSNPLIVQLDITPVCDYSQDKNYVRTIMGLAIDEKFYNDCRRKGEFYYQTSVFNIEGKNCFFLFDFRHIVTLKKQDIEKKKMKPFVKLRKELHLDIQAQLSNQVNRPGVSVVE